MKKLLLKIILAVCIAITIAFGTGNYTINKNIVSAEEVNMTEINMIKDIDTSLLPTEIKAHVSEVYQIRITYENQYNPDGKNERLTWYLSNGSGVATISVDSYDANGDATVTLTGSSSGTCYIVFIGTYHDKDDGNAIKKLYSTTVSPYESVVDSIKSVLSSTTVVVAIFTLCLTLIWRVGKKIFDEGEKHKSNFVSKTEYQAEQHNLRESIKEDIKVSEDKILKSMLREVARETRPIAEVKTIADDMKTKNEILDVKIEEVNRKLDETKKYGDRIRILEDNVNRMKYESSSTEESRRVGR